jgi:hypothetical protein
MKLNTHLCISLIAAATVALSGCGGSSGSQTPAEDPAASIGNDGATPPLLYLTVDPVRVEAGGYATLTWSASAAEGCDASGGWQGSRATSGNQQIGPLEADTNFRLSCSGPGGGVSSQVAVTVDTVSAPLTVSLRAEPEQVAADGTVTLTWSAQGADACTATGAWSGARATAGTFTITALDQSSTFGLSCTGPQGNALSTVNVVVLDGILRWDAPTVTVDGEPLRDLGGYMVYWGSESGNYTGSHRIEDSSVTQWRADLQAGEYYFALTAFDAEGNESPYSNEIRKTIL